MRWYQDQFNWLDLAINDLATDNLLSGLSDMDGAPSAEQQQRLMQQAMGLMYLYFLMSHRECARIDFSDGKLAEKRLLEVAEEVAKQPGISASVLLMWHSSYINHGAHFGPDGRGQHERDYLLSNEDLQLKFKMQMQQMAGDETLTVDGATEWVNEVLLNSDCRIH